MQYSIFLLTALASLTTALPSGSPVAYQEQTYVLTTRDLQTLSENLSITGRSARSNASWRLARTALTNFEKAANNVAGNCPVLVIAEPANVTVAIKYVDDVRRRVTEAYEYVKEGKTTTELFCGADQYLGAVGEYTGGFTA